jgi:cytochrome c oxidase assembly factor CtaG
MSATLDWLLAPPLTFAVLAAVLHGRGTRHQLRLTSPARIASLKWRTAAFYAALATVVAALDSPIDAEATTLFWVHMVQHVMLMMVAAPLLVLAAPWIPIWRGLAVRDRRRLALWYLRSRGWRAARGAGRRMTAPLAAWILFDVNLCAWHVPALYDLTLRSWALHDLEHVSFLLLGVVFWLAVIDSPPLHARLDPVRGIAYVVLGATVAWALAVVLAFTPAPLYSAYAELHARPGGLTGLADQQIAAGIMWGPGSIPYAVFVFIALYRWLAPESDADDAGHNGRRRTGVPQPPGPGALPTRGRTGTRPVVTSNGDPGADGRDGLRSWPARS